MKSGILFLFRAKHSFFESDWARGLRIQPTPDCQRVLSGLEALFQPIPGGFRLVCPVIEPRAGFIQPAVPVPLELKGAFELIVEDPDFYNFTQLPDLASDQILYGNNLQGASEQLDWDPITLKGAQFRIDLSAQITENPCAKREFLIETLEGNLVMKKIVYAPAKRTYLDVDLSGEQDGGYRIRIQLGEEEVMERFFLRKGRTTSGTLGYFEWYVKQDPHEKWYESTLSLHSQRPIQMSKNFTWEFEASRSVWQYYLVNGNGSLLQAPQINYFIKGKKEFSFSQTKDKVTLPDGRKAMEFVAAQALPFREVPIGEVFLKAKGLPKDYQLPFASPRLLAGGTPKEKKSRIYIYL